MAVCVCVIDSGCVCARDYGEWEVCSGVWQVLQTRSAVPGLLLYLHRAAAAVMARPRFAYTCKQHRRAPGLERIHCNTRLTDWNLVEDPGQGPMGIWSTTCPECRSFIAVEVDRERFEEVGA